MRTDCMRRRGAGVLVAIIVAVLSTSRAAAEPWEPVWEGGFEQRIVKGEFDSPGAFLRPSRSSASPWAATGSAGILRELGRGWFLGPVARGSWGPDIERVGVGLRLDRRLGEEWSASITPGVLIHRDDPWFDAGRGNFYGVVRVSFRDELSFEYRNEMVQHRPLGWALFRTTAPPERTLHDSYLGVSTARPPAKALAAGLLFALAVFEAAERLSGW